MAKRVFIFANPIAGRGRGVVLAQQIGRALVGDGYEVRSSFEHPAKVGGAAFDSWPEAVICVGGDGTLRSVVTRFLDERGECPPVLPIPLGTANLMARHLGMRWTAGEIAPHVVATLKHGEICTLDAGRANDNIFLLMAGVGIDAQVVHLLDSLRDGPIDLTSYMLPAALTLANFSMPAISASVDDAVILKDTPAVAFVGNVREYGTGFPILTQAIANDGLLDVCVLPCKDRRALAEMLLLVAAGEHPLHEHVIYMRGKRVRIESKEGAPVQLDGDAAGHTPLTIEVLPGRVRFFVPVNA